MNRTTRSRSCDKDKNTQISTHLTPHCPTKLQPNGHIMSDSCSSVSLISNGMSTISLMSWICAQLPQIYTNYKNKSADGISPLFLLLWFMGDFLSFTSCLLNDVVLKFQVYLSLFFIGNDIMLCFQYYYYNSIYPKRHGSIYSPLDSTRKHNDDDNGPVMNPSTAVDMHINDSEGSSSPYTSSSPLKLSMIASTMVGSANALSTMPVKRDSGAQTLGLVLAWSCTVVYMLSRCPQLYKNYQRKSVEGINSVLFGAALVGNLTYTLSILTSCEFIYDDQKSDFFMKELPYILGSSGTVIFDVFYFYQKYLYRNSGKNTQVMGLQDWDQTPEHS